MYSVTIFKNQYDNKTHRTLSFDTWNGFSKFLYKLSNIPLGGKRDAQLISPASYVANTTRSNKNVLAWESWCAVDVDDYSVSGAKIEDDIRSRFHDWNFICYSTASSTNVSPKFRMVFPLTERVEADRIKHFWFALNTEMEAIGDRQTKDVSRMYFIPASYSNAFNFIFNNESGSNIDPYELMSKHKYNEKANSKDFLDRLPDAWKEQIIEYRKGKLDNDSIVWTSYRDCPFWPKTLATEYISISGTGWYRQMYRIMIAVAGKAIEKGYPITADQIVTMCRQFDIDTGKWYENRPMNVEANNALEYAYKNGVIQ